MNYDDFLHSKIQIAPNSGFSVSAKDIHPALKPHQRDAVMWAIRGGRRALFESFGLGKTVQELESAAMPSMIVCALLAGVSVGKNWKWRK